MGRGKKALTNLLVRRSQKPASQNGGGEGEGLDVLAAGRQKRSQKRKGEKEGPKEEDMGGDHTRPNPFEVSMV